jgi:hypothetical protein
LFRDPILAEDAQAVLEDVIDGNIKVRQHAHRKYGDFEDSPKAACFFAFDDEIKAYAPYSQGAIPSMVYLAESGELPTSIERVRRSADFLVGRPAGVAFNSIQLHVYKGDVSSIDYHRDHDQIDDDVVLTVTAGAAKRLCVREKKNDGGERRRGPRENDVFDVIMNGGDAYVMTNHSQRKPRLEHSRPKEAANRNKVEHALSLVFRKLKPPPKFDLLDGEDPERALIRAGYISEAFHVRDWPTPTKGEAHRGKFAEDEPGASWWKSRHHLVKTNRHHLAQKSVAWHAKEKSGAFEPAVSVVLGPGDGLNCPNGVTVDERDHGVTIQVEVERDDDFLALAATAASVKGSTVPPDGLRVYVNEKFAEQTVHKLVSQRDLNDAKRAGGKFLFVGTWRACFVARNVTDGERRPGAGAGAKEKEKERALVTLRRVPEGEEENSRGSAREIADIERVVASMTAG